MTEIASPEDLSAEARQSLANWLMAMSDTKHLLGLRYAEWCTGAPELEADIADNKAITNSERANQLIATADGALGQVSNLLNDIRGLVVEGANEGALSAEQIAANQLQIDSSLEAIDRISQVTTFQGRRILDGSLDFVTTAGLNFDQVNDLTIDQANL